MSEFKWAERVRPEPDMRHGDLRLVTLPVKCFCEWSDKIADDVDEDTGAVLSYKSGFILKVLPTNFVYNGQETVHMGQVMEEKTTKP